MGIEMKAKGQQVMRSRRRQHWNKGVSGSTRDTFSYAQAMI